MKHLIHDGMKIGMIARWQPVHLGHAVILNALQGMESAIKIGLGSANRYNYRKPFTHAETVAMLRLVICEQDRFDFSPIPDLNHGEEWAKMIHTRMGALDILITANPYVKSLLSGYYQIMHPLQIIKEADRVAVDGSMVRLAMAKKETWQRLVPDVVAWYIQQNALDVRFREEFGLQTLASITQ